MVRNANISDIKYVYIYMHKNKLNNKMYIGCTYQNPPELRFKYPSNYKHCRLFYEAIQEYGWDNFEHTIIEEGLYTLEYAYEREDYWINYYDTRNPEKGYNVNAGGYKDVSPNMLPKAIEWMSNHPEFCEARINDMHKWQKEHPEEMLEIRRNNVKYAINARKRPVVNLDTEIIYESASEASRKVEGTTQSKITMCCKGDRKTCGGYHWRYADEYDK